MFKAYIDESGIHSEADMFVLAGYLAPEKEWDRFTKQWQAVLDEYSITAFHAVECNGNKGEFSKFKDKREERNQFVEKLLTTISRRPRIIPINVGLPPREFPDPQHSKGQARAGHPYYVCMKMFVVCAIEIMKRMFPKEKKIGFVFDRQDQFDGRAIAVFNGIVEEEFEGTELLDDIAFRSKKLHIPLQAADALAFDSYQEFRRRRERPESAPRPSYRALTANKGVTTELILDRAEADAFSRAKAGGFLKLPK